MTWKEFRGLEAKHDFMDDTKVSFRIIINVLEIQNGWKKNIIRYNVDYSGIIIRKPTSN